MDGVERRIIIAPNKIFELLCSSNESEVLSLGNFFKVLGIDNAVSLRQFNSTITEIYNNKFCTLKRVLTNAQILRAVLYFCTLNQRTFSNILAYLRHERNIRSQIFRVLTVNPGSVIEYYYFASLTNI